MLQRSLLAQTDASETSITEKDSRLSRPVRKTPTRRPDPGTAQNTVTSRRGIAVHQLWVRHRTGFPTPCIIGQPRVDASLHHDQLDLLEDASLITAGSTCTAALRSAGKRKRIPARALTTKPTAAQPDRTDRLDDSQTDTRRTSTYGSDGAGTVPRHPTLEGRGSGRTGERAGN